MDALTRFRIRLDRAGFPMLWLEPLGFYIHWLPITKIQFEYFLCSAPDARFDEAWYDEILELNPRLSPSQLRRDNYWRAFLTGIKPSEVQHFAQWCGENYEIPTLEDWFEAYKYLKSQAPASDSEMQQLLSELRNERARMILKKLETETQHAFRESQIQRTLADQMLMRLGAMEWVHTPNRRTNWGGMGQPHPLFFSMIFTPDNGNPSLPNNPNEDRLYYYGFRLIKRD
ncbi:MAG: hypothetical protein RML95_12130 [Anaerolineae bacterium]|nr:hypothetical protein [Anaerolineae bacterium]